MCYDAVKEFLMKLGAESRRDFSYIVIYQKGVYN